MIPSRTSFDRIGTIAAIRQMAKVPTGGIHVIVEGLSRATRGADYRDRARRCRRPWSRWPSRPSARSRSTHTSAACAS